jgi:ornithine cyclodeaminase/alanine dehydrogenase-like protein (mu-crystallin family)
MLGAGGMARTHMEAFTRVRKIETLQVFSPTRENRERFAYEMAAKYNIEVKVCNRPEDVYKGAHILAALTDSAVEVTDGALLEKGTHIVVVGGSGKPDTESLKRVDVYLRFGDTPAPSGHPELATDAEHIGYEARPQQDKYGDGRRGRRKHGNTLPDRRVTLADLVSGKVKGRSSPDQITYSERGNLQGAQFHAVAGKVYALAKRAGLGREIPTEWFLQDIRDKILRPVQDVQPFSSAATEREKEPLQAARHRKPITRTIPVSRHPRMFLSGVQARITWIPA